MSMACHANVVHIVLRTSLKEDAKGRAAASDKTGVSHQATALLLSAVRTHTGRWPARVHRTVRKLTPISLDSWYMTAHSSSNAQGLRTRMIIS